MLVLMLMSMLMSHASVDLFVLSFVLLCAYAYVAGEDQASMSILNYLGLVVISHFPVYQLRGIGDFQLK